MNGFGLRVLIGGIILFCALLGGCAPEFNSRQPVDESQTLSEISQLTSGFERAVEAYFSPDMKWIVFQAVPKGEQQYQMYVARLQLSDEKAMKPVRITPANSRNTCG